MSVLFIADISVTTPISGSEQVLYNQANGLVKSKLNVFALTRRNGTSTDVEYFDSENLKIGCYGADVNNKILFFISLFKNAHRAFDKFTSKTSFSVSISHQPFTCFALLAEKRLTTIPLVYIFHSPNHEEYLLASERKKGVGQFVASWLRKAIEGYCLKKSAKIVVLSKYMKKKVIDIHGIADEKIIVNPGGVDLDRFHPLEKRALIKEELELPTDRLHLLTVRNLEPRMGLDNLIRAIYLLREKGSPVHLTIGGEGPERKFLDHIISAYGLRNDISLTGFIPAERLSQYYAAADFFILPTRELEGFGLVTIESMACGTPVLGTPVGATTEILSNFDSRFLFKSATPEAMAAGIQSSIVNIWSNPYAYNDLRERCRDYVKKKYSWQKHIMQLKSIMMEVTAGASIKSN